MFEDRVIHCSDYEIGLTAPLSQWLEANGIDPLLVPADNNTITVTGGQITYESFVLATPAEFRRRDRDLTEPPVRELRTVPLISHPEAHGL